MAGVPPVGRRARTARATPSNYVRTTLLFGAHPSSRILTPPVGRRARTTRATPSNYVRTTLLFGAHSSSRILVPPIGRRARTTRTTLSKYVRTTLLFGANSSSRLLVASVPRQLCHVDYSAAELPKPHPSDLASATPPPQKKRRKTLWDTNPRFQIVMRSLQHFIKKNSSCWLLLVIYDVGMFFLSGRGPIILLNIIFFSTIMIGVGVFL